MLIEQNNSDISKLVDLERSGRLTFDDKTYIRKILRSRSIKGYSAQCLYQIADCMNAKEIRKIGIILLNHEISLMCGICGRNITKPRDYTVDHIIPKSKDGIDLISNLQHAHDNCNCFKDSDPKYVSFYNDNPALVLQYRQTFDYQLLLTRLDDFEEQRSQKLSKRNGGGRESGKNSRISKNKAIICNQMKKEKLRMRIVRPQGR